MRVITLSCNQCGAPLEVSSDAQFTACFSCEAKFAIEGTEEDTRTELLEEPRIEEMDGESQKRVASLEAEWLERSEEFLDRRRGGGIIPTRKGAKRALLGWIIPALSLSVFVEGGWFFGIVIVLIGLASTKHELWKADRYREAFEESCLKRQKLIEELAPGFPVRKSSR